MYGLPVHGQRTKTNAKTCKKFNKIKKILNNLVTNKKLNNNKNMKNKNSTKKILKF